MRLALGGIALLAELGGSGFSVKGMILALCSAGTYSAFVIANRKCSFSILPSMVIVFYVTGTLTVLFSVPGLFFDRLILPPDALSWVYSVSVGWLCSLFALLMLNKAIRLIGATNAAIGNLLEPIISLFAGAVIYGDKLTFRAGLGCVMILSAVLIISFNEKNSMNEYNMLIVAEN